MAVNVGTIEAVLRLKDQFSGGMKAAAKNAEAAAKRLQSVSSGAKSVGKKLTLGVTLPLIGAATAAVKFSQDLNKGMANVATLIPGNIDRVKELKTSVQDLSIATATSTDVMAEGLYQVISAFGDSADTVKILELNARAAAAGLATTSDAIALTSAVTKGYGDTSFEAMQKASDLAFTTVKLGQTSFPELAGAIGKVAIGAAGLKISQEELNAVFATMTGVTGQAREVATQFRGAMVGLKKPSEDMLVALKGINFETGEAAIASLGFQGTLQALMTQTGNNAGEMAKLFESTESWDFIQGVASTNAEKFSSNLEELADSAGATDQAFRDQTEGINAAGFAWGQLKSELMVVGQQIGDELQPVFNDIVRTVIDDLVPAIKEWIGWFKSLDSETKKSKLQLAALVVLLPPLIFFFGAIGSAVSGVILMAGAIKTMTAGTWLATLATRAFTVAFYGVPIIGWIAALVSAGIAIYVFRDKIKNLVKGAFHSFLNSMNDLKVAFGRMTREEAEAAAEARLLSLQMADTADSTRGLGEDIELTVPTVEELTEGLEHLVTPLEIIPKVSEEAAEATEKFADDVADLVGELTGQGLIRQAALLEQAYVDLNPEQLASGRIMGEVSERALELRNSGVELSAALNSVADGAEASALRMEAFNQALDRAKAINKIIDEFTGADVKDRVNELQAAWNLLTESQKQNTLTLRAFSAAVVKAESEGGVFNGTLGDLDTTVLEVEDSAAALLKGMEALKKKFGKSQLQNAVALLNHEMLLLQENGQLTEEILEELGKAALGLRKRGADLEGTLEDLADAAEEAAKKGKDLGEEWRTTLKDLSKAFDRLANIAGGRFRGIARAIGTVISSMELAAQSANVFTKSIGLLKSGDTLAGIRGVATGVVGIVSALDAATASGNKFQRVLGGMAAGAQAGAQIGGMFGPMGAAIGTGIGAAAGGILGMFRGGGLSKDDKAANQQIDALKANVLRLHGSLSAVSEMGGEAGKELAAAWGSRNQAGLAVLRQKLDDFNEGLAETERQAQQITQLTNDAVDGLKGLVAQGKATGEILPAHLEPYLVTLRDLGLLTEEDEALLMQMAESAHVDWKAMKTSAEKYGISLEELGPAFDRKRLEAAAKAITADWEILNQEGVNTITVLKGMSGSVQDLMDDAFRAGVDIPASMKPIITQMVNQGLLTDANGNKLTDMAALNFAEPIEAKFQLLIDKIGDLIDSLTDVPPEIDDIKEGIQDIPTDVKVNVGFDVESFDPDISDITVGVHWDYDDFDDDRDDDDDNGYRHGTGGKFVDFGSGTMAMLHGKEAIVPERDAKSLSELMGRGANDALLNEVAGLRREIHNLPIHLRDAILLTQ